LIIDLCDFFQKSQRAAPFLVYLSQSECEEAVCKSDSGTTQEKGKPCGIPLLPALL